MSSDLNALAQDLARVAVTQTGVAQPVAPKEPSESEVRAAAAAAEVFESGRQITHLERRVEGQILADLGAAGPANPALLPKKQRVDLIYRQLLSENPQALGNSREENKLRARASKLVGDQMIEEELARQAAERQARRRRKEVPASPADSSGSSAAGFYFGGSADNSPAAPSRESSGEGAPAGGAPASTGRRNARKADRAGTPAGRPPAVPVRRSLAAALAAEGGTPDISALQVKVTTKLRRQRNQTMFPLALAGAPVLARAPSSPKDLVPALLRRESSAPVRRMPSDESSESGPSSAISSQHPPTPPDQRLRGAAAATAASVVESEYGLKRFGSEEIQRIRYTQRSVSSETEYEGAAYSIQDLSDAYLRDFRAGHSEIPPIHIVPLVVKLKDKERGERIPEGCIEQDGVIYRKTGAFVSVDNRRLLAINLAIQAIPPAERERFSVGVTVCRPFDVIDSSYFKFGTPGNPYPEDTYMHLVFDRIGFSARRQEGGAPELYTGFSEAPRLVKPKE